MIVYVDGYNLYYSRLRGTPHKWLDLVALLREGYPHCQLGIVAPLPEPGTHTHRRGNSELQNLANWTRHYIRDEELAQAQLPDVVPTRKKAARRPSYW